MKDIPESQISAEEAGRLLPSLSTRKQLLEVERLNINEARLWAMGRRTLQRSDLFSVGFVQELHRRMYRHVWKDAGTFRTINSDKGWEPARIEEGVKLFLEDADGWARFSTYPVHESAVRLHHRLVSVRPWSSGNGRHARLMADVAVAAYGEVPLTWGLRKAGGRSPQELYVEAIAAADNGDMGRLITFAKN